MKTKIILCLSFLVLCITTIFCYSTQYSNYKWHSFFIGIFIFSIIALISSSEKIHISRKCFISYLVLICYIFIRETVVNDFSIKLVLILFSFVALFLSFIIFKLKVGLITILSLLLVPILLQACYGLGQFLIGVFNGFYKLNISGSFDNPAGFSSTIMCGLPLCYYLIAKKQKKSVFVAVILLVLTIIISGSRAALIGSVLSAVIFYCKFLKTLFFRLNIYDRMLIIGGVILFCIMLFLLKEESIHGRILIWKCSLEMIKEQLFFGYGFDGFTSNYMYFQATFFKENPGSYFAMLADDTKHPFNEFIRFIVEYGLFGLLLLSNFILVVFWGYKQNRSLENKTMLTVLIIMGAHSCFSYPLDYPFVWVILVLSICCISFNDTKHNYLIIDFPIKIILISICLLWIYCDIRIITAEQRWKSLNGSFLLKPSRKIICNYRENKKVLYESPYFLFNYAIVLNEFGDYEQSNQELELCCKKLNNIDMQLLQADNYIKMNKFREAEDILITASYMCPNRFIPLYQLFCLYNIINDKKMASIIASEILKKPVKVPSMTVEQIKNEMRNYLEEQK